MKEKTKKHIQFPHTIIFILILCLIMTILTWIIPSAHYKAVDAAGIVEGSEGYKADTGELIYDEAHYFSDGETTKLGPWRAIREIVNGFAGAKSVIFLILIAFATISLISATGALDAVVASCVRLTERRPSFAPVLIVFVMFLMAFWGGTGTISYEEIGPFIPIFLLLCTSLGYDPIVGLATCAISMGFGFSSGYAQPFTTGTAHMIVGLPSLSGAGYRVVCLIVSVTLLAVYTLRYAKKVKRDPSRSLTADMDFSYLKIDEQRKATKFTPVRILCLISLFAMIGVMFYELMFKGEYIDCCTALFLALFLIIMLIRWLVPKVQNAIAGKEIEHSFTPSETAVEWLKGMSGAVAAAIIVGFGYGVSNIMSAGGIKDPMIHAMVGLLGRANIYVSVVLMFFFQTFLNFLVPSGSGQAMIAMPIIGPIAQGIGLNLQTATLAFNFGDGFSNLIWPTAFVFILTGISGIPVDRYYKWVGKLFLYLIPVLIILLEISIFIWQGVY